jgi:hypothetical protein
MREQTLIQAMASALVARAVCEAKVSAYPRDKRGSLPETEWLNKWTGYLKDLEAELPSGSGIDSGSAIDLDRSTGARIVIGADYHHMDGGGSYDGWTEHTIIVTPAFDGIEIHVTGRNRNDIKEYLAEVYQYALTQPAPAMAAGVAP